MGDGFHGSVAFVSPVNKPIPTPPTSPLKEREVGDAPIHQRCVVVSWRITKMFVCLSVILGACDWRSYKHRLRLPTLASSKGALNPHDPIAICRDLSVMRQ